MIKADARWLTVAQACGEYGLAPTTVKGWVAAGRVRARRVGQRVLEIERASLEARLANPPPRGRPRRAAKGGS